MPHSTGTEILQWVERARKGSSEAFDAIVDRLSKPLEGYFLARIKGNAQACEDLVQDTWIDVWKDLEKSADEGGYDPSKAGFYTYVIHRFARHKVPRWFAERKKELISLDRGSEETRSGSMPADPHARPPDDLSRAEEEALAKLRAFEAMFRLVFLCGGYPNQQLAFACSKLLFGRQSDRAVEGTPEKVAEEHGGATLSLLLETFRERYLRESRIAKAEIEPLMEQSFSPLRKRLPVSVEKLMEKDRASLDLYRPLGGRIVGKTCLKDYYERRKGGHTAAIPDWCYKVQERIKKVANIGNKACNRCKLRHLPPCADCAAEDRIFAHHGA